jgi:cytochrome P450
MTEPLLSEEYFQTPETLLARLRREDPVHLIEGVDALLVTRHDDVLQLYTDPHATNDPRAFEHYRPAPEGTYQRWLSEHGFFSAPEDEHARLRRLVSGSLTPRGVRRMQGQIESVVEQFAAKLRGRTGVVDLVSEFTSPVPNTVISRITGIPPKENDEARFRELARQVISGINPLLDDEGRKAAERAILELCDWVRELTEERAADPQEDMISDLLREHEDEGPATVEEIILVIAGLVAAGTETTALGMKMGLRTLFRNPDQLAQLREDRSLLPNAVRELLRYDFGSASLPRYALEDFELRGTKVRKGQLILLSFMGSHRDPDVFPDPDRFDIHRDTKDLIIFGHGPHFCLGANLAQLEMGCMLDAALDFLPEEAVLLEDQIEWQRLGMFSSAETLPVDFG